jgi:EAL domain-containing protein (putative c-di-GMP-specific phosphodiesterase class I)
MEVTTLSPPDIKAERDRYVAFAFAAADLLIEIDRRGVVVFCSGAAQQLTGRGDRALLGRSIHELFAPEDRGLVAAELAAVGRGGRSVPVPTRLAVAGNPAVTLGICRLPDRPDVTFLTFSLALAPPTADGAAGQPAIDDGALAPREAFAAHASRRLAEDTAGAYRLTLVKVAGLAELRQRVSQEVAAGLDAAIGRRLKAGGPDVEMASQIAEGRFGLLHRQPIDARRLTQTVESLAAAADPTGEGVKISATSVNLDKSGLSEADAARALLYAVQSFADSEGGDVSIRSLREGVTKLLAETMTRVANLRTTVTLSEFRLDYQPVVALGHGLRTKIDTGLVTGTVHHCEALARFPKDAPVAAMVAFAEATGLVSDLDLAICQRVIERLTADTPGTIHGGRIAIAVNLSGRSLESAVFRATLLELLKPHAALSPRLLFEVTESAAITRFEEVNRFLQALRGRGFRLCLDDFGAGTNSFNYLRRLSVDFVKIDGSFVSQAATNEQDLACLKAIVSLSRDLKAATIAEMIETPEQLAMLRRIGIDFGQGYLLGRPHAEPVASDFLNAKKKPGR